MAENKKHIGYIMLFLLLKRQEYFVDAKKDMCRRSTETAPTIPVTEARPCQALRSQKVQVRTQGANLAGRF